MNAFSAMSLSAFVMNVSVGAYVLSRGPKNLLNRLFFSEMLFLAAWSAGEFVMRVSTTESQAIWGSRIASMGWCAAGGLFLLIALTMSGRVRLAMNPWMMSALFLPGAVCVVLVWTTDLVFQSFTPSYWGYREIAGPLRWLATLYVAALFVTGVVILARLRWTGRLRHKREAATFVLAAASVPIAAGLLTDVILPLFNVRVVEFPMFSTTIIAPVMAYGILRYGVMTTIAGRLGSEIVMKMNDPVVVTDRERRIESMNPAATRLTGLEPDDATGVPLDELLVYSPRSRGSGKPEPVSWTLCPTRGGRFIPVTVTSNEVRRKSGRLVGSIHILRDMTESLRLISAEREIGQVAAQMVVERTRWQGLKRSEQEERKLSGFLENVIDNIAEPICILDRDERYIYVNAAFADLTGYDRKAISGLTNDDIHWHSFSSYLKEENREAILSSDRMTLPDLSLPDRHGAVRVVRAVITPVNGGDGDLEYLLVVINDMTEQKQLEEARLDFIRVAAHELKTPLTALKLGFDVLVGEMKGSGLDADQQRSLDVLSLSIERLSRLASNLLDLASMDAGLLRLEVSEIEVASLFADSVALLRAAADEKGISIEMEVPDPTPVALADRHRVSQVIDNLLSNAVKFTDSGTVLLSVSEGGDGMLSISVSDTGPGIPAARKDEVFSRFVKAQRAQRARGGTGLGLSISKAIVEAHGGVISVEDRKTGGSVFSFTVPAARQDCAEGGRTGERSA